MLGFSEDLEWGDRHVSTGNFFRLFRIALEKIPPLKGLDRLLGGGGSFLNAERSEWEKTFNVCWFGVYYCTRAFMPMILKANEAHIVNTSSVNGFWASLGPTRPHTAYSAAKFAVKGFTEALINDLRLNAPHVKCSVVMPGHVGTSIMRNSRKILTGKSLDEMSGPDFAQARKAIAATGMDASALTDEQVRAILAECSAGSKRTPRRAQPRPRRPS